MDYKCAPDYYSIAFLSGCISITISVLGPNPDKEMHTHTFTSSKRNEKGNRKPIKYTNPHNKEQEEVVRAFMAAQYKKFNKI